MKLMLFLAILLLHQMVQGGESLQIYTTEYPPYQSQGPNRVEGISADIVREILKEAQITATISILPWSRAEHELASKKDSVLFFSLSRTADREKKYQWIADITPTRIKIWKLKKRSNIVVHSLADLNKYYLGTMEGVVTHRYLLEHGVRSENFYRVSRDEQLVGMLNGGHVDLIALDEVTFWSQVKQCNYSPDSFEMAFPLPQISGNAYLVANLKTPKSTVTKLQRAWQIVKEKKIHESIRERYLTEASKPPSSK
ncbi:substrate-binding periplasmic protein [Bdellovibrio svalbardensis]|uniref:Transporter substrate-binding domain-containing protein n=1 Tax=Bdellovibrio svalbardensis TaxID=2972972 RepID=A0ABT6DE90_9BACT|nr:transporter substrate-binding domain-containing protein [Bdellovibrio svalbardensis]MDG0815152.1 transporter substrate-binding domain-containing protein [Bdellovibrio svalbardensis]